METLLQVEDLWKKYSRDLNASIRYAAKELITSALVAKKSAPQLRDTEFWSLRNVNFSLKRGDILGVLGHNGAGKSTLLKCIAGKLQIDQGKVIRHGELGHLLEMSAGFSPRMTGRDNVAIRGRLMGMRGKELENYISKVKEFAEIDEFFDAPVQFYSSGMKSRLGFSASSVMEPDILIIDEVLAVGDLGFRLRCYERINELSRNAAVVFVSHSLGQVARLCNRAIYLEKGQVLFDGEVQNAIAFYQDGHAESAKKKQNQELKPELIAFFLLVDGARWEEGSDIAYGSALSLNINISKLPNNIQVRIVLRDPSNSIVMDWNSARESFVWPENPSSLHVDLGMAELCPGAYSMFIQVMSPDGIDHLCMSKAIFIRISGNYFYANAIQRKAKWSFLE